MVDLIVVFLFRSFLFCSTAPPHERSDIVTTPNKMTLLVWSAKKMILFGGELLGSNSRWGQVGSKMSSS